MTLRGQSQPFLQCSYKEGPSSYKTQSTLEYENNNNPFNCIFFLLSQKVISKEPESSSSSHFWFFFFHVHQIMQNRIHFLPFICWFQRWRLQSTSDRTAINTLFCAYEYVRMCVNAASAIIILLHIQFACKVFFFFLLLLRECRIKNECESIYIENSDEYTLRGWNLMAIAQLTIILPSSFEFVACGSNNRQQLAQTPLFYVSPFERNAPRDYKCNESLSTLWGDILWLTPTEHTNSHTFIHWKWNENFTPREKC